MGREKRNKVNRKYKRVKGHSGIYQIFVKAGHRNSWHEPDRGGRFASDRFVSVDSKRKRIRRTFATFEEAKLFRYGHKGVDLQIKMPSRSKRFGELRDLWLSQWLPNRAISTQIRYKSYLSHFKFFDSLPIEEITPTCIDSWIMELKSPDYLARFHSTRQNYFHEFSVLKQIFGFYCSRFNRNFRQPFLREHRSMLVVREREEVVKDLSVVEVQKFLLALRDSLHGTRFEAIYYVALIQYLTYSRIQDVAALHFEDFNFERGEVTINKKVIWPRTRSIAPFITAGSKANGGKTIPVSKLAKDAYLEWAMLSGRRTGMMFSIDGGIISYRQIEYRYSKALKKAGLPFSATHILRHASLSEYYGACRDLKQTARVAGHGSIKSTDRYAKVREEHLRQTQVELDNKMSDLVGVVGGLQLANVSKPT